MNKVEYDGKLDAEDKYDGYGKKLFANGDIYEGFLIIIFYLFIFPNF